MHKLSHVSSSLVESERTVMLEEWCQVKTARAMETFIWRNVQTISQRRQDALDTSSWSKDRRQVVVPCSIKDELDMVPSLDLAKERRSHESNAIQLRDKFK